MGGRQADLDKKKLTLEDTMRAADAARRCAYPWQQMIIDLTGEVVPCCFWSGYGNFGKPLGNTNVDSIDEIWRGEGYRSLRAKMASGDLQEHPCGNCMAYRWGNGTFPKFSWPAGFVQETGHCHIGKIPEQFCEFISGSAHPVRLFEDDVELPFPDALHDDIRGLGGGRYSVWHGWIFFSSSDQTDPLSSGRCYQLVCGERRVDLGGLIVDTASGQNIQLAYREFLEGRPDVVSEPSMISFISTADCNIDCPACSQNVVRVTRIQHRPETTSAILSKVPFLSQFIWHGGEPYLIKSFRKFIDSYKLEDNPNLTFGFTSNGTMINKKEAEKLKKFPRINASISIDSFNRGTFKKIRAGAELDHVWQNLKRLLEMYNAPIWVCSVGMIVCKSNFLELTDNLRFAIDHDIGLNLSPVVIYPATEQLNCFADFELETAGWRQTLEQAAAVVMQAKADNRLAIERVDPTGMVGELSRIFEQARQDFCDVVSVVCNIKDSYASVSRMARPAIVAYVRGTAIAYVKLKAGDSFAVLKVPRRLLGSGTNVRIDLLHDVMEPNGVLCFHQTYLPAREVPINVPSFSGARRPKNISWANYGASTPDGQYVTNPEQIMEIYLDLYKHELQRKDSATK